MMFWYGDHLVFWQVGVMLVGMIAFWGLLIWGIYALVTGATRKHDRPGSREDARQILDQRLARGEIDAEEYLRLRDLISSGAQRTDTTARNSQ